MRVLQIDKFLYDSGGSSRIFLDTIDGLRARGEEVAEFAMQDPKNRKSIFARYFAPAIPDIDSKMSKLAKLKLFKQRFFSDEVERRLGL